MNFGDKWLAGPEGKPLQLIHKRCGKPCSAMVACSACNQEVRADQVSYRDGPGAGTSVIHLHRSTRRSADPTAMERRRPSSVARTLQVIGDRWSFMILREAFLRTRRFDDLQARLGIAPNILADRLARLVESGVFRRERYQTGPDRHEYRFTDLGRDLYNPMIVMLRWGDAWLANGKPPMILRHATCGRDFNATVVCDQCGQPLDAREMGYVTRYAQPPRVR
jgi:DNA-binding HxlR family transcriptional regulator